ncbi:non-ribosomal peptide synthetase [Aspergillus vadensis CBS 113365]|uniref:Acetyl-CoA synthetase-like protein n=1 Tax=Aspergillus vadensis (strain CBS 113365 / IMI 142717 / IBT 24658) TaxID=1448311 RepID=A0A319B8Q0_ASPVC|nr:acetyl-CoA synthetase-like protein [Aspergillus vadensis CBS 113365]PYH69256.1 acetyl-CoA synthetase-like protein [Aspergillus vadensis CBS 113365]
MASGILTYLEQAAEYSPSKGFVFYSVGKDQPETILYPEFWRLVKRNAQTLVEQKIAVPDRILLVHFDTHKENIIWFWSAIAAGSIPAVSTPLAVDPVARERHLTHLQRLLERPNVLTSIKHTDDLSIIDESQKFFIEDLASNADQSADYEPASPSSDLALLLLTSGSTGNAKAVMLHHSQIFAAIEAKWKALSSTPENIFLNWIGFDHVACFMEMHMHALSRGCHQIHLPAVTVLENPLLYLEKMAEYSVTNAFAPNFLVALVGKAIEAQQERDPRSLDLDLSHLRMVLSGGEANLASTSILFNRKLVEMGAAKNVLHPSFGMTETCAGIHYHYSFPELEQKAKLQFCSVGQATPTLQMRITDEHGETVRSGENGNLELYGPMVFKGYYNDDKNTKASFTEDGWFKTGDTGYIDNRDNLVLSGRSKDSIIINGINFYSHELENAIDSAGLDGLVPSYTVVVSSWLDNADSEDVIVLYLSSQKGTEDDRIFLETINSISRITALYCSKQPVDIIPLPVELLPKNSLGKLPRTKLKLQYEEGRFNTYRDLAAQRASAYRARSKRAPQNNMEETLAGIFADEFDLDVSEVGVDDSLYDMGVNSVRLIRYKRIVETRLGLSEEIPMITILQNPTIEALAVMLQDLQKGPKPYNPIVQLQDGPSKAPPIFFFHPGMGEVLVFLNFSKYFADRKVYAFRAPGFNPGEKMFTTIDEMTDTYLKSIRELQPEGPYIFIGYSYGAMIAFETAKKVEASGDRVGFLGSLNLPPHIKKHIREMDYAESLLHLVYFLGFITEEDAHRMSPDMHKLPQSEVLPAIMKVSDKERVKELAMDEGKIRDWAMLSSKLQELAHTYDPSGTVQSMDVFYAIPLLSVGRDKDVWLKQHLMRWKEHSKSVRFHDVPGSHHTMMAEENVFALHKILRAALNERGML